MPYIVLVTSGKHESVDRASVKLFDTFGDATDYIFSVTRTGKYWTQGEIVSDGIGIELGSPE